MESGIAVTKERNGEIGFNEYKVPTEKNKNSGDHGDGYRKMWMYLMPQNNILKNS